MNVDGLVGGRVGLVIVVIGAAVSWAWVGQPPIDSGLRE